MKYVIFDSEEGNDFLKAITKLRNADEAAEFFTDMFTPSEARAFVARWRAAQMLNDKIPYLDIQKTTGLSSATVARVSQSLQYGTGGFKKVLDRFSRSK